MRKGSHSTRSAWSFSGGRAKSRDFDNGAGRGELREKEALTPREGGRVHHVSAEIFAKGFNTPIPGDPFIAVGGVPLHPPFPCAELDEGRLPVGKHEATAPTKTMQFETVFVGQILPVDPRHGQGAS